MVALFYVYLYDDATGRAFMRRTAGRKRVNGLTPFGFAAIPKSHVIAEFAAGQAAGIVRSARSGPCEGEAVRPPGRTCSALFLSGNRTSPFVARSTA